MKMTTGRWTIPLLLFLAGWTAGCMALSQPTQVAPLSPHSTEASEPFPIPILVLDGDSAAIGTAHGVALSAPIHTLYDGYLMKFVGEGSRSVMAMMAASVFESKLRPEHRIEVQALAKSTGEDEHEAMLAQCFLDLSPMTACSTIALPADASPDHVARFGRNLDFLSMGLAEKYSEVFVIRPTDGRYAFASVGWPGVIGVLSGMNEHGLCLANMEVTRQGGIPRAVPYTLLYRTLLERCRTVDEAITLLQSTPIQTANNLMLMDASGNRAVVELSPEFVHVRRGMDGSAVISTNHQRDQDTDTAGRCDRYDYLHDASKADFGKIDELEVQNMLTHVGNRTTLQTMVFEPVNRVIYLSVGKNASTLPMHRVDLTPYFTAGQKR